ncbi:hypothetical protein DENSPDRAFT_834733 [Dentipellis sp. KUC8613]|nr:hypothetical protein DENSPDRAFT_834733 [Dentipellis sp. KUC8613]
MAMSFIGKQISLISHSDVRYRGILAGIDPQASTIQLSNVFSMGTETRRPPEEFIPPVQEPYQYIIFRASEVKDLAVDEPPPRRNVHDDPAVLGASAPVAPQFNQYGPASFQQQPAGIAQPVGQQQGYVPRAQQQDGVSPQPRAASSSNGAVNGDRRNASVTSAAASLETVERALGDLRVAQNGGRGGRRGGHRDLKAGDLRVPAADFDFASSNAKFDKTAVAGGSKSPAVAKSPSVAPEEGGTPEAEGEEKKEEEERAYNPTKSFFDTLSSSTQGLPAGQGGGRGRGRGGGRNRREEERERNVATFGEPGGVGLMGPGAYVGGWGGYGRRGGGRGRRNPQASGR